MAFALTTDAWLYAFQGNAQAARSAAEELLSIVSEQGFALWFCVGEIISGLVRG